MEPKGKMIRQFMWPYQIHFRISVEVGAKFALQAIGLPVEPTVLLVGFKVAGDSEFDICIEPEDGPYAPGDFSAVKEMTKRLYLEHPERGIINTNARLHEMRQRGLLDEMRGKALSEVLGDHPASGGQTFFASRSTRVGDYEVHVVLGVPSDALADVPRIQTTLRDRFRIVPSLVHAVIYEVLRRASLGLYLPDPGDGDALGAYSPEIVRAATERFVRSVMLCVDFWSGSDNDLLFSSISALPYEGRSGVGRLILAKPDHPAIEVLLRIRHPVKLHDTRAVRKLLEASGDDADLLVGENEVYGFGRVTEDYDPSTETVFVVSLSGRGAWDLSHGNQVLLSVRDGKAMLPVSVFDLDAFVDLADRLLPNPDVPTLLGIAHTMAQNDHGAMLIVSSGASAEAERLSPQAWAVDPAPLSPALLRQLTAMDGAVLIDPQGKCHAIGAILDGQAAGKGDPARGSRFNNAVRYLNSSPPSAIIVVYSADGSVDILPQLHLRQKRSMVDAAVQRYLDVAAQRPPDTKQVYGAWDLLEKLNFYLSSEQCKKVNEARRGIDAWEEVNSTMRLIKRDLVPQPDMNDSYWLQEES
jgi:hypothetical protein